MDPVLKKLNFRGKRAVVVAPPPEVAGLLESWSADAAVSNRPGRTEDFLVCFVRSCAEIERRVPTLVLHLADDAVFWMAYPKKSSKRYVSDIGRDDSWAALGTLGFEPVRQVAIDADWSALRFRETKYIKSMTRSRSMALSDEGKRRSHQVAAE